MMRVGGLEVKIMAGTVRFPVQFRCQFRTPLHDQDVQEWKGIIRFNFHCEFYGRFNAVEVVKKFAAILLVHVAKP
jgi:hypothetical protein